MFGRRTGSGDDDDDDDDGGKDEDMALGAISFRSVAGQHDTPAEHNTGHQGYGFA
jgi:hypothetical protein